MPPPSLNSSATPLDFTPKPCDSCLVSHAGCKRYLVTDTAYKKHATPPLALLVNTGRGWHEEGWREVRVRSLQLAVRCPKFRASARSGLMRRSLLPICSGNINISSLPCFCFPGEGDRISSPFDRTLTRTGEACDHLYQLSG